MLYRMATSPLRGDEAMAPEESASTVHRGVAALGTTLKRWGSDTAPKAALKGGIVLLAAAAARLKVPRSGCGYSSRTHAIDVASRTYSRRPTSAGWEKISVRSSP